MRLMTAAEYLRERGWSPCTEGGTNAWSDPAGNGSYSDTTADGVTIQRARDAEEERRAWVAFAAAARRVSYEEQAAQSADMLLAQYIARFAVEVVEASAPGDGGSNG
jgi:hypothetical protein